MARESTMHITDLIPAYVLGALEPEEVDAVERHLAEGCTRCAADLNQASHVKDALLVAPALDAGAPPALRERLLNHVRSLKEESHPAPEAEAQHTEPAAAPVTHQTLGSRLRALFGQSAAGNTSRRYHLTGDHEVDRVLLDLLLDPHCAIVGAPGTSNTDAYARLVTTQTSDTGVLLTNSLQEPESGKVYQVWLLRNGHPVPNALFTPDHHGQGASLVRANAPILTFDTVAVTPEPIGGSLEPTGPIVLAGPLQNA